MHYFILSSLQCSWPSVHLQRLIHNRWVNWDGRAIKAAQQGAEWRLSGHAPGSLAVPSVVLLSSQVTGLRPQNHVPHH